MRAEPASPALILFAKSPVPGRVKTRLMPELTARQAAEVAAELIQRTVRLAVENWPGPVRLQTWPDTRHAVFNNLAAANELALVRQSAGDLGRKMHSALATFTDRGVAAAVMGCDVPHCPAANLRRAHDLLAQGDNVIGPSRDGGYYLIGLQRTQPALFRGIAWGGDQVLPSTLRIAAGCGIRFTHLERVADIDSYEDLKTRANKDPYIQKWINLAND
jgi:rSAM/selenodomain-associated transferase 1